MDSSDNSPQPIAKLATIEKNGLEHGETSPSGNNPATISETVTVVYIIKVFFIWMKCSFFVSFL